MYQQILLHPTQAKNQSRLLYEHIYVLNKINNIKLVR